MTEMDNLGSLDFNDIPESLHQQLYLWCERSGLISDVRTYLRQLIINNLQCAVIECKSDYCQEKMPSTKMELLNILIAEFLTYQHYHYTLSVFSSEVSLFGKWPKLLPYLAELCNNPELKNTLPMPKLSQECVREILLLFGFPLKHHVTLSAMRVYSSEQSVPLMVVISEMVSDFSKFYEAESKVMKQQQHDCYKELLNELKERELRVSEVLSDLEFNVLLHQESLNEKLNGKELWLSQLASQLHSQQEKIMSTLLEIQEFQKQQSVSISAKGSDPSPKTCSMIVDEWIWQLENEPEKFSVEGAEQDTRVTFEEVLSYLSTNDISPEKRTSLLQILNKSDSKEEISKNLSECETKANPDYDGIILKSSSTQTVPNTSNVGINVNFAVEENYPEYYAQCSAEQLYQENLELKALISLQNKRIEFLTRRAAELVSRIETGAIFNLNEQNTTSSPEPATDFGRRQQKCTKDLLIQSQSVKNQIDLSEFIVTIPEMSANIEQSSDNCLHNARKNLFILQEEHSSVDSHLSSVLQINENLDDSPHRSILGPSFWRRLISGNDASTNSFQFDSHEVTAVHDAINQTSFTEETDDRINMPNPMLITEAVDLDCSGDKLRPTSVQSGRNIPDETRSTEEVEPPEDNCQRHSADDEQNSVSRPTDYASTVPFEEVKPLLIFPEADQAPEREVLDSGLLLQPKDLLKPENDKSTDSDSSGFW